MGPTDPSPTTGRSTRSSALKALVDKARGMGFKVMLDWVANHTGWDCAYGVPADFWEAARAELETVKGWYDDLDRYRKKRNGKKLARFGGPGSVFTRKCCASSLAAWQATPSSRRRT